MSHVMNYFFTFAVTDVDMLIL